MLDCQTRSRSFVDFAFFLAGSGNLRSPEEPTRFQEGIVSTNYFDVLGVRPAVGRFFFPEEAEPRSEPDAFGFETLSGPRRATIQPSIARSG